MFFGGFCSITEFFRSESPLFQFVLVWFGTRTKGSTLFIGVVLGRNWNCLLHRVETKLKLVIGSNILNNNGDGES